VLQPHEKAEMSMALEKLFMFQGKKADKNEVAFWIAEMCEWHYPVRTIIEGIESLNDVDIHRLTLGKVKESVILKYAPKNTQLNEVHRILSDEELANGWKNLKKTIN